MQKSLRIPKLINYLKTCRLPVSLARLSQEFGLSEKTIRRDIKEIGIERNAPWVIYFSKVHLDKPLEYSLELEHFWFKKQEMESLFTLNQIIQQLVPGSLKHQLEPFKKRIDDLLTGNNQKHSLGEKVKLIEIADRDISAQVFQTATQGLLENKCLQIDFWQRSTNKTTHRKISPQKLVRYRDNWLLDAYCHLRKGLRSFPLETITVIQLLDEQAISFSEKELQQHFQSSYGIFAGEADKLAIIKFSSFISRWVQYENWHPKQVGHWDSQQNYQLHIPYHHDQELIQDILKYAEHAEVISPIELREKIQQKLKNAQQVYAGTSFVPDKW